MLMTHQEKESLFCYLCAVYHYKVICEMYTNESNEVITEELHIGDLIAFENGTIEIKPYLRTLDSMTKEEEKELRTLTGAKVLYGHIVFPTTDSFGEDNFISESCWIAAFNWLDRHHFDYRGFIERRLALEAPESMYKN